MGGAARLWLLMFTADPDSWFQRSAGSTFRSCVRNLKLGRLSEVPPLLHHVVPVDVTELQPELTDDVVFMESVEVKNLHDDR